MHFQHDPQGAGFHVTNLAKFGSATWLRVHVLIIVLVRSRCDRAPTDFTRVFSTVFVIVSHVRRTRKENDGPF